MQSESDKESPNPYWRHVMQNLSSTQFRYLVE